MGLSVPQREGDCNAELRISQRQTITGAGHFASDTLQAFLRPPQQQQQRSTARESPAFVGSSRAFCTLLTSLTDAESQYPRAHPYPAHKHSGSLQTPLVLP